MCYIHVYLRYNVSKYVWKVILVYNLWSGIIDIT